MLPIRQARKPSNSRRTCRGRAKPSCASAALSCHSPSSTTSWRRSWAAPRTSSEQDTPWAAGTGHAKLPLGQPCSFRPNPGELHNLEPDVVVQREAFVHLLEPEPEVGLLGFWKGGLLADPDAHDRAQVVVLRVSGELFAVEARPAIEHPLVQPAMPLSLHLDLEGANSQRNTMSTQGSMPSGSSR